MLVRKPYQPLVIGFAVSVLIHGALLPSAASWLGDRKPATTNRSSHRPKPEPVLPDADEMVFGSDRSMTSSVAWINHEDFRQLMAPQADTEQPALQRDVDPVAQAPIPVDPTPATPTNKPTPEEQQAVEQANKASPTPQTPASGDVMPPVTVPLPIEDGQLAMVPPNEIAVATSIPKRAPADQTPKPKEADPSSQSGQPSNPTAAARSDRESDAFTTKPGDQRIQPGEVLTSYGLEIKTVRPRFSVITLLSVIPDNPRARIVFNGQGQVVEAALIRSSGSPNVDGPVLASLYQWQASGKRLEQLVGDKLEIRLDLILMREQ